MCSYQETNLDSVLKIFFVFFIAIYYFNLGLFSPTFLWLLPFITQSLGLLQAGGFLSELFYLIASIAFVNIAFYISLHDKASFDKSAAANIIFRLIGISGWFSPSILKCKILFLYDPLRAHYPCYYIRFQKSSGVLIFFSDCCILFKH